MSASCPSPDGIIYQVGPKLGLHEGWKAELCKLPPGVTCSGHSLVKEQDASALVPHHGYPHA